MKQQRLHLLMHKCYLLLRNNQQSGPFTLEEVKQLPLLSKDLVWIIGQSAGWLYPEEIEDLRIFVNTGNADLTAQVTKEPEVITDLPSSTASTPAPAQRIYVSRPVKESVTTTANLQGKHTEAQTHSFEERVEKMRERVAAVHNHKAENREEQVETKYSRSLEDIKAEYTDWLKNQRHKRTFRLKSKPVSAIVLLFLLVAGFIWLVKQPEEFKSSSLLIQSKNVEPVTDQQQSKSKVSTTIDHNLPTTTTGKSLKASPGNSSQEVVFIDKTNVNIEEEPAQDTDRNARSIPDASKANEESPIISTSGSGYQKEKTASINVAKDIKVTADYIAAQKQKGIGGLAVTIKNNSALTCKVIAIDVVYFTDAIKEIERKTLYFTNVTPGKEMTLHAPAHKKAEGAYAQIGLVSSESGSLYYASN